MYDHPTISKDTTAWIFFVWASFMVRLLWCSGSSGRVSRIMAQMAFCSDCSRPIWHAHRVGDKWLGTRGAWKTTTSTLPALA